MNLQFFKENKLNILLTILYALFTLLVVMHHEIWADEAQVWQLCKYLSLPELFKHLVNEGHPSFFYLLVMPFAKMGFSIFSMQLICWAAMCASVFLFLAFSPFNKFAKFAIVTSCGFLYFLPVIARSYSILPLIVFALAILYPKQKQHPFIYSILIFLMANTHAIMVGFAGLLGCLFVYENLIKDWVNLQIKEKKIFISSALVIFFGIFLVWLQLHGTTDSNVFIKLSLDFIPIFYKHVLTCFFANPIYRDIAETYMPEITYLQLFVSSIACLIYVISFIFLFLKNKKFFFLALFSILFQIAIYIISYGYWIFVTRIFCTHIILIFCLWCAMKENNKTIKLDKTINWTISLFFLLTLLNGLQYCVLDLFFDYSGSKETAQFIEKNIDKNNSILVTSAANYAISIVQYLNADYIFLSATQDNKKIKYVFWDNGLKSIFYNEDWQQYTKNIKNSENKDFKEKDLYVLIPYFYKYLLNINNLQNYTLIFESQPTVTLYEGFSIYKYNH